MAAVGADEQNQLARLGPDAGPPGIGAGQRRSLVPHGRLPRVRLPGACAVSNLLLPSFTEFFIRFEVAPRFSQRVSGFSRFNLDVLVLPIFFIFLPT